MSQEYASDVALEPIIWIVDNFSGFLGPVRISITNEMWTCVNEVDFLC